MRNTTIYIRADQLSLRNSAIAGVNPDDCIIFMMESRASATRLPHHKQKLAFLWSAMRHFADQLRDKGYTVDYHEQAPSFSDSLKKHAKQYKPARFRFMEPAEFHPRRIVAERAELLGLEVEITPDTFLLSDKEWFARHAKGKKTLLLEAFYRHMRKQTGLLMKNGEPVGGSYNFDAENRETPDPNHAFPRPIRFRPDDTTRAVIDLVKRDYPDSFGSLDTFHWPVTRKEALRALNDFLDNRLDLFGPYQDAMVKGEPYLYHSLLSPLLNVGLLDPFEVCQMAEARFSEGKARLNSVEGFIRQIIGWREFVYQVYHYRMPEYLASNHFNHDVPLPAFYWDGETDMACIADAVANLMGHGINHHIQRLMITGTFALTAGVNPQEVNDWYLLAYADAFEWVVTPNVLGLSLYADGGYLATKPYAASANYINRMSDCCKSCHYNPRESTGENACPYNALYWDFLARNRDQLKNNPRMGMMYKNLERRDDAEVASLRRHAREIRKRLKDGKRV